MVLKFILLLCLLLLNAGSAAGFSHHAAFAATLGGSPSAADADTSTRLFTYGTDRISRSVVSSPSSVVAHYFTFDGLGNLTSRADAGVTETLTYDTLNRLSTSKQGTTTYAPNGNILTKPDVAGAVSATYAYGHATKPHAVTSAFGYAMTYDANGNIESRLKANDTTYVKWAGFDKPRWLTRNRAGTITGSEFHYNAARSRVLQLEFDSTSGTDASQAPHHYTRKRTYALGSTLELNYNNTVTSGTGQDWALMNIRIYVPGPDGAQGGSAGGIIGTREFSRPSTATTHFNEQSLVYHYDHLGSITAITDYGATTVATASGNKSGRYSEDAWGQRRDPSDWSGPPSTSTFDINALTPRGYTGHEMLDDLGLVHMNGRIYDPLLGRFLSADLVVDGPGNLQGYNRYSYVANNPLSFTDKSGFSKKQLVQKLGGLVFDSARAFKTHRAEMAWKSVSMDKVITHADDGRAIINGRAVQLPADAKLGETYKFVSPESGKAYDVPISKEGFVDFSKHRIDAVDIKMTGDSKLDMKLANEARGSALPDGYTWHHNQNGKTMEAVPSDLNNNMPHTGGNAVASAVVAEAQASKLEVVGGIVAAALAPNTVSAANDEGTSVARTIEVGAIDILNLLDPGVQDVLAVETARANKAVNVINTVLDTNLPELPTLELGNWDELMNKDKK